jgi:rRNA processing protein Krr1/Pno1
MMLNPMSRARAAAPVISAARRVMTTSTGARAGRVRPATPPPAAASHPPAPPSMPPAATAAAAAVALRVEARWGGLLRDGVHGSPAELIALLIGGGGARARAIARASGASVRCSGAGAPAGAAAVALRGSPDAVAAAAAACDGVVTPSITLVVAEEWRALLAGGVDASPDAISARLSGPGGERLRSLQAATGAAVWLSPDRARVFISGGATEVARARAAIAEACLPAASIDVGAEYGRLIDGGVHASAAAAVSQLIGPGGERLAALQRATRAAVWVSRAGASTVHIAGPPGAVAAARALLTQALTPAATIDVAAEWRWLVDEGVHDSVAEALRNVVGPGASRLRAIARASGAAVWASPDGGRLFISGGEAPVARARAAIETLVAPRVTLDVARAWRGLLSDGVHASPGALTRLLVGPRAARLLALEAATGAVVRVTRDGGRLFLSGDAAAVARARAAIEEVVVPAATIDTGRAWGHLLAAGVHASPQGLLAHLMGPRAARLMRVEAAFCSISVRLHVCASPVLGTI